MCQYLKSDLMPALMYHSFILSNVFMVRVTQWILEIILGILYNWQEQTLNGKLVHRSAPCTYTFILRGSLVYTIPPISMLLRLEAKEHIQKLNTDRNLSSGLN